MLFGKSKTAEEWFELGLKAKNPEEKLEYYSKALELNPKYDAAWHNKGYALRKLGRYEEAIKCYDKALELNPKDMDAWYNNALSKLSRYEEAIECYDKALELNPKDDAAWYNKGTVLYYRGRYEEAIKCYDKAIELNPKFEKAKNNKEEAEEKLKEQKAKISPTIAPAPSVTIPESKPIPIQPSASYLSLERTIYDPVKRDFIISSQRQLPNVRNWIEKNDPSMYWFIICVNNESDRPIDEWGIELETPATLKILDARIEGTEHAFNVTKSFSRPWLPHWTLGISHHLGVVIPRKGSKRVYFKLGSDACGISYSIKGKVSTQESEVPIKEKQFKYSCDAATLKVAIKTNPEEAEKYTQAVLSNAYSRETALKLLQSFRIVREIDVCCARGNYGDIEDKLYLLKDALESAKAGERLIRIVRDNLESIRIMGETDASAQRAAKLCGNLVDLWINEVLRT